MIFWHHKYLPFGTTGTPALQIPVGGVVPLSPTKYPIVVESIDFIASTLLSTSSIASLTLCPVANVRLSADMPSLYLPSASI